MTRHEEIARLSAVHYEYEAARLCVSRALEAFQTGDDFILAGQKRVRGSHLRHCRANLEITYAIRLFAEFEAILRTYWADIRPSPRPRRTMTETMMNRIAARRRMPHSVLLEAHDVRAFRNGIIHDRLRISRLRLDECKSRLCRFLSHLPLHW